MNKGRLSYGAKKNILVDGRHERIFIYTQISMNFLLLLFVDYITS